MAKVSIVTPPQVNLRNISRTVLLRSSTDSILQLRSRDLQVQKCEQVFSCCSIYKAVTKKSFGSSRDPGSPKMGIWLILWHLTLARLGMWASAFSGRTFSFTTSSNSHIYARLKMRHLALQISREDGSAKWEALDKWREPCRKSYSRQ